MSPQPISQYYTRTAVALHWLVGTLVLTGLVQQAAQVDARAKVGRILRERPLVRVGGFRDATLLLEHVAEVVVRVRVVGHQLDRLPDERLGFLHAAEQSHDDAAEVPGIGTLGRQGQDAPVELVGRL